MLKRIGSFGTNVFSKQKKPQQLESYSPTNGDSTSPDSFEASPRYVWDKRTASLMSLDTCVASSPDLALLATPIQGGLSPGSGPNVDGWQLTPGHLSAIQPVRERLYGT